MDEYICLVRVIDHRNEMPFQFGIHVANTSLKNFFYYLEANMAYLKINFYIRNMGCANDHPTRLDFKYIKCWYDLSKPDEPRTNENNECATANMMKSMNVSDLINDGTQSNIDNYADNNTSDTVFQECNNVSVKGLSEGLIEPSEQILKTLQLAEQVFRKVHGELFRTVNDISNLVTVVSIEKPNCIRWA
ncbi:hypothetical protein PR048_002441 [Dryococelus australis]|uniref:Uncharacterized protein n=1 Tax=Dryococelus australis TaxID=614101 RepID=A0ABQ9IK59_9NEOP|nr:hypothetical protein PR048_002441 [Dryococelus australis]